MPTQSSPDYSDFPMSDYSRKSLWVTPCILHLSYVAYDPMSLEQFAEEVVSALTNRFLPIIRLVKSLDVYNSSAI